MSDLVRVLHETARACVRAAHLAEGDVSDKIEEADLDAMQDAWKRWEDSATHGNWRPRDGFRAELQALVARGWRRVSA